MSLSCFLRIFLEKDLSSGICILKNTVRDILSKEFGENFDEIDHWVAELSFFLPETSKIEFLVVLDKYKIEVEFCTG